MQKQSRLSKFSCLKGGAATIILRTYAGGGGVNGKRTGAYKGGGGVRNWRFYCVRTLWMPPKRFFLCTFHLVVILASSLSKTIYVLNRPISKYCSIDDVRKSCSSLKRRQFLLLRIVNYYEK